MKTMEEIQVVIIEDNIDNIELITSILAIDVGITRSTSWESGQAFFKWFYDIFLADPERQDIDLILLDLQMPRENGYEIFKKIKQEPLLRKALIVAVTANVMQPDVARTRDLGFDGFIGKPISIERFPAQIQRILAGEPVWEPH
jgi:CheY-like chemotaxis protein